jgi:hypothetical protein
MRIQLLCDHKWRDLPNLTVIKLLLERAGHRVLMSTTKDAEPLMQSFRPDCVVFNHLFGGTYRDLSRNLRDAGVAVVMLPTEGAMRPEFTTIAAGEFADFSACDLFLNWSAPAADLLRERWDADEDMAPIVGCTRFDFYHPDFKRAITPREEFCRRYGLDPDRRIVTWATQYGYAHIVDLPDKHAQFVRDAADIGLTECCTRIGLDVADVPRLHAEGREATSAAFFKLAQRMPDVQFIIRPHPVEDRNYYRRKMQDHGLNNVGFCPSDYIWNILNVSDVHLHRQCTTAVEAWMWNKPTVEMAMDDVPQWRWDDREAGSDIVADADALVDVVASHLGGRAVEADRLAYRRRYLEKWFGPFDGKRCMTAASRIDSFLAQRGRRRRYFSPLKNVRATPRTAAAALARYALSRTPNERLLGPSQVFGGPEDKLITRRDVASYTSLVTPALT